MTVFLCAAAATARFWLRKKTQTKEYKWNTNQRIVFCFVFVSAQLTWHSSQFFVIAKGKMDSLAWTLCMTRCIFSQRSVFEWDGWRCRKSDSVQFDLKNARFVGFFSSRILMWKLCVRLCDVHIFTYACLDANLRAHKKRERERKKRHIKIALMPNEEETYDFNLATYVVWYIFVVFVHSCFFLLACATKNCR